MSTKEMSKRVKDKNHYCETHENDHGSNVQKGKERTTPGITEVDELIEEYKNPDIHIKTNANFRYNLSGLVSYILVSQLKQYSLEQYIELGHKEIAQAHVSGDLHVHNLHHAFLCGYCTGWNLSDILQRGLEFEGLDSLPAGHFDVAIDHMINFACCAAQEWQ